MNNYYGFVVTDNVAANDMIRMDEELILSLGETYQIVDWFVVDSYTRVPIIQIHNYKYCLDIDYCDKVHLLTSEDELLYHKYYSLHDYYKCHYISSNLQKIFCDNGWRPDD